MVGRALQLAAAEGKDSDVWDAPGGPVWRFYDLDNAGTWGEAKLRAFLEVSVCGVGSV